jgi:hypothetical protein
MATPDTNQDFPGPYAVFEGEYIRHDHPDIIAQVRAIEDGVTGTLVSSPDGGYDLQDAQRPPGVPGANVLPDLVVCADISRVFDWDGSHYTLGQIVGIQD